MWHDELISESNYERILRSSKFKTLTNTSLKVALVSKTQELLEKLWDFSSRCSVSLFLVT